MGKGLGSHNKFLGGRGSFLFILRGEGLFEELVDQMGRD